GIAKGVIPVRTAFANGKIVVVGFSETPVTSPYALPLEQQRQIRCGGPVQGYVCFMRLVVRQRLVTISETGRVALPGYTELIAALQLHIQTGEAPLKGEARTISITLRGGDK